VPTKVEVIQKLKRIWKESTTPADRVWARLTLKRIDKALVREPEPAAERVVKRKRRRRFNYDVPERIAELQRQCGRDDYEDVRPVRSESEPEPQPVQRPVAQPMQQPAQKPVTAPDSSQPKT
jgi:hypothetical protein